MLWYYPVISAVLVLLSGLFSGLTLGEWPTRRDRVSLSREKHRPPKLSVLF